MELLFRSLALIITVPLT